MFMNIFYLYGECMLCLQGDDNVDEYGESKDTEAQEQQDQDEGHAGKQH